MRKVLRGIEKAERREERVGMRRVLKVRDKTQRTEGKGMKRGA